MRRCQACIPLTRVEDPTPGLVVSLTLTVKLLSYIDIGRERNGYFAHDMETILTHWATKVAE